MTKLILMEVKEAFLETPGLFFSPLIGALRGAFAGTQRSFVSNRTKS